VVGLDPRSLRHVPLVAAAVACAALLVSGCEQSDDNEAQNARGAVSDCEAVGEPADCACADGQQGSRVCLSDGTYTDCHCPASGAATCNTPGAEYACACPNGGQGTRFCLRDGGFSPCDCSGAAATAAGSGAPAAGSGGGSQGCPAGFSCVDMQGFEICVDASGIPPFCNSEADCAAEGLGGAMCTDPGVGAKVCVQLCS
jgi:hypothetical protein